MRQQIFEEALKTIRELARKNRLERKTGTGLRPGTIAEREELVGLLAQIEIITQEALRRD